MLSLFNLISKNTKKRKATENCLKETRRVPVLRRPDPVAALQEAHFIRRQQQHLQLQVLHLRRNRTHLQGIIFENFQSMEHFVVFLAMKLCYLLIM